MEIAASMDLSDVVAAASSGRADFEQGGFVILQETGFGFRV